VVLASVLSVALAAAAASGGHEEESPGPGPAAEIAAPTAPFQRRIAFLPLASYGSNVGLQVGGALVFYDAPPGGGPRRDWLAFGGSWATRGPRQVEVKGERLDVLRGRLRTFWQAKYSADDQAPYWGEGARLAAGDRPGAGSPPDPYRWRAVGPWISLAARAPLGLGRRLSAAARVRFRQLDVHDPGAALEAARPPGFGGGTLTTFHGGALFDTRDDEISPSRGVFADAWLFGAPPLDPFSAHGLWGANAGVRAYRALAPGLVLAVRGVAETKLGDVPFHERTQVEGADYGEGLGGPDTIRGVARARLAGEEKLLANVELRATVLAVRPWDRLLELGLSAGADAGRARQRGWDPLTAAAVFGGVRAIWDRALVVRFEVGWAGQGAPGWYLAFDESF
jgi:hypothetical protein